MLELLGAFGPRERATTGIVTLQKLVEQIFEILFGTLDAVCQPLLAEDTEETLDQVHPQCVCRGVMKSYTRMARQLPAQSSIFVDVQIVRHDGVRGPGSGPRSPPHPRMIDNTCLC